MNKKIIYYTFSALLMTCIFTACSSSDSPCIEPIEKETTKIELDSISINVGVGESAVMNIKNGNGDYHIFSEDTAVAKVNLNGTAINIETKKKGITGIVVSDKAGNYKRFLVKSMYKTIATDVEEINIAMKLGSKDGRAMLKVTEGNGGYEAVCDNEEVALVGYYGNDKFQVYGKKEGTANITITDMMGLKKTIKVTVSVSKIPFTEEEKEDILALDESIFVWGELELQGGYFDLTAEPNLISCSYYSYYYIKFNFDGDISVGKKLNGNVEYTESYYGAKKKVDNVDIEILKVEGKNVWGIASKVEETTMQTGYFCVIADK